MFDKYFSLPRAVARHQSAPLTAERESFLGQLETFGTGRVSIRTAACYLLQIIEGLGLRKLRDVTPEEITRAANHWGQRRKATGHQPGRYSAEYFAWVARRFLRFHGRLKTVTVHQPFSKYLDNFLLAQSSERGLSEATIRGRRYIVAAFLTWYKTRHKKFREVSVADVDGYIQSNASKGWSVVTQATESGFLRAFFRYAESHRWCRAGIASAILSPPIRRDVFEPQGPDWRDVLRLLRSAKGSKPADIRAKALLSLFAFYGLRSSEAARLLLEDIDWVHKRFTVRRAKHGGFQEFPLDDKVGTAIRHYIETARPRCSCPNVFVTLNGPYRPLVTLHTTIAAIVRSRMQKLGIRSKHYGPQSLRHACATRLLNAGASFVDIADFLGHRDTQSVNVYARLSTHMLREVAEVDLIGAL